MRILVLVREDVLRLQHLAGETRSWLTETGNHGLSLGVEEEG